MTQSTEFNHILLCFIIFQVEIVLSKQYQPFGESNHLELEPPHNNVKYVHIDLDQLDNNMRSNGPDDTNKKSKDTNNIKIKTNCTNQKLTTKELGHENFRSILSDNVSMRSKDSESNNEKSTDIHYKYNKSYCKMHNEFKTKELDHKNFKSNGSNYEDIKTDDKTEKSENKNHKRIKTRELHNDDLNLDHDNTTSNLSEQNQSYEDKKLQDANYMNYIYEKTNVKNKKNVTKKELNQIKYFKAKNCSDHENMRSNNSECKNEKLEGQNYIYIKPKQRKHKTIKTTEQDNEYMTLKPLNHDSTTSINFDVWNNTSEDTNYIIQSNKRKHERIKTKERDQENMKLKTFDDDNTRLSNSNSENRPPEETNYKSDTTNEPDNINLKSKSSDYEDMRTDDKTESSENSNYIHFKSNLLDQVVVTKEPDVVTTKIWTDSEMTKSHKDSQEAIARLDFIRNFLNDTTRRSEVEEEKTTLSVNDVFFAVRTTQLYHDTRLSIILKTWFPMAKDMTYFFTDFNDDMEEHRLIENHMVTTNCNKTYSQESLCCKMESAFTFFYDFYKDVDERQQPRWFCHFDDDNYVNINTLLKKLSEFDAQEKWYIGRQYTANFDPKGKYLIFAERGAGICLSRTLLMELQPHIRNRKFFETCERNDIRDDEALGYIIREKANGTLTDVPEFQGDVGDLPRIPTELLRRQITVGYRLDRKVVKVLGFSVQEDPTRLISLHCYLYPDAKYCKDYKEAHIPKKAIDPIREFKFMNFDPKENDNFVYKKERKRRVKPSNFWQKIRSFFLTFLPKKKQSDEPVD